MNDIDQAKTCTVFSGHERVTSGPIEDTTLHVRTLKALSPESLFLFFDDATGEQFDVCIEGTEALVLERLRLQFPPQTDEPQDDGTASKSASSNISEKAQKSASARGRPKLNVIAREVTLQPRHWQWLKDQPGSASSVLRNLIDQARRNSVDKDKRRHSQKSTFLFISAIAGNLESFEEAIRCLFAFDQAGFEEYIGRWPEDIVSYAKQLSEYAFIHVSD